MKYIALAEGVRGTRTLLPANINIVEKVKESRTKDIYFSLFQYDNDHYEQYQEKKSLAGMKGVKTDKLFFDFDDAADIDKARSETLELYGRLVANGIPHEHVGIYFSGGKGFHIEVLLNQELTNQEFKNIIFNLAGDLSTFDVRVSDEQRIIRAPLAKHDKTGLYKIPLTPSQLAETPIKIIKEIATDYQNSETNVMKTWARVDLPESLVELKSVDYKNKLAENILDIEDIKDLAFDIDQLDLRKCPKWLSPERFALQEGFFLGSSSAGSGGGERNDAFMILAATYKNQGINRRIALAMLMATSELQAARTDEIPYSEEKLSREVIDVVYSPDWTGGIYAQDHPLLIKTRKRFGISDVTRNTEFLTGGDMFDIFTKYAINIDENTIKTGLPIDDHIRLTIGMPVALLGGPSSGKTTTALNILRNTSKSGINSIFFSLDMHNALLCQRQLAYLTGDSESTIFRRISTKKGREIYKKKLNEEFENVSYFTKAGVTVDDIRMHVEKKKRELGDNLKLVMIDYLECIRGPYSDPTTNSAIIADGIKNIATELDVCVILLVQPPKLTGGAAYPLTNMYQIKGSSMVAQAMRAVIGIYREGFSPETFDDDNFITFVGLKNSMGPLFKKDCHWNGATSEIRELTGMEEDELGRLRKMLESKRSGQNDI